MAAKNVAAKTWTLTPSYDGLRYSAYPNGDKPVSTPVVLFTDAVTGPTSGGESGLGCYLTIYGYNFGSPNGLGSTTKVYIGTTEVANYRYLVDAKVSPKLPGLKALCVQVGSLGGAANGTALAVKVTVAGTNSNTDNTFTPCAGNIYFVSLTGRESNDGSFASPRRYLQTTDGNGLINGGISTVQGPGDHIIIRGGNWSDATGHSTCWYRFRYPAQQGTALRWVHFTAYPGPINGNAPEVVHYTTPAGMKGGIMGPNSAYVGTTGDYVSVSNMWMESSATASSDAAPINLQYASGAWRVANMELGPWPSTLSAPTNAKGGGVAGHGVGTKVLGCNIRDMACVGALENHGIYVDSAETTESRDIAWEIAYNWIHGITGGNLIQIFDNVGNSSTTNAFKGFKGMLIHHNFLQDSGKYGLNFATGSLGIDCYNNVVIGSTYAGLRLDLAYPGAAWAIRVAFNTFYNCDRTVSGSGNAQVLNDNWNSPVGGTIQIKNNIFHAGANTVSGSSIASYSGGSTYWTFDQNIYYGTSQGWASFAADTHAIFTDPQLANPAGGDFTPGASGSAYNAATITALIAAATDLYNTSRPQGANRDIGAVERLV